MSEEDRPVDSDPASGGDGATDEQQQDVPSVEDVPVAAAAAMNLVDSDSDEENSDDDEDSDEEDPMASLPPYVLDRVEKLKELNEQRDKIMEQYLQDRAALEAKYHSLCEPLYVERANVVKGLCDDEIAKKAAEKKSDADESQQPTTNEDTMEETENQGETEEVEGQGETEEIEGQGEKAVGIPQFWVCCMSHMEPLAELITEEDVDCLEKLQNVVCNDDPEGTGFTLEFQFAPNDYFHNSVLTKRYEVPNLLLADEPILKNVEGCKIQWKPGRSLTYREITKKQRGTGKNSGMVRTVKKKERSESFFHFFEPPKMPSMDDMDEDEADRLEEAFEQDYDVAQAFRSHIIPQAVLWFTGQALEEEEVTEMLGADMVAGADNTGANPFPPSAPGEQPPECQQN